LVDWLIKTAEAVREKKEEKYPVTSQVVDYIKAHLADEIYLDVLAAELKMSSGYLSSYFKAKTGMNIVDYINETRIAKAASLLDDDRLKIRDAAQAVGYRNITSFNRMFKKYTGLTPSEYRKRNESN
jgi:YesN/AraC family two-component response regulator